MPAASVTKPKAWYERDLRRSTHFALFFRILLAMGEGEFKFPENPPGPGKCDIRYHKLEIKADLQHLLSKQLWETLYIIQVSICLSRE